MGARALAKLIKPKKEGTRERLRSSVESPSGHSESTEATGLPSPSQVARHQESLDSPSSESNSMEVREQSRGSAGKGR